MATDQSHQCYIDGNTLKHSACDTALIQLRHPQIDGDGRTGSVICPKCKVEIDPNDRGSREGRKS